MAANVAPFCSTVVIAMRLSVVRIVRKIHSLPLLRIPAKENLQPKWLSFRLTPFFCLSSHVVNFSHTALSAEKNYTEYSMAKKKKQPTCNRKNRKFVGLCFLFTQCPNSVFRDRERDGNGDKTQWRFSMAHSARTVWIVMFLWLRSKVAVCHIACTMHLDSVCGHGKALCMHSNGVKWHNPANAMTFGLCAVIIHQMTGTNTNICATKIMYSNCVARWTARIEARVPVRHTQAVIARGTETNAHNGQNYVTAHD